MLCQSYPTLCRFLSEPAKIRKYHCQLLLVSLILSTTHARPTHCTHSFTVARTSSYQSTMNSTWPHHNKTIYPSLTFQSNSIQIYLQRFFCQEEVEMKEYVDELNSKTWRLDSSSRDSASSRASISARSPRSPRSPRITEQPPSPGPSPRDTDMDSDSTSPRPSRGLLRSYSNNSTDSEARPRSARQGHSSSMDMSHTTGSGRGSGTGSGRGSGKGSSKGPGSRPGSGPGPLLRLPECPEYHPLSEKKNQPGKL